MAEHERPWKQRTELDKLGLRRTVDRAVETALRTGIGDCARKNELQLSNTFDIGAITASGREADFSFPM